MGDLGTVGFDQGSGAFGISTLENKVPTAYEEADHGVGTLGHGIDAVGNTNVIGYSNTIAGVGISLQYNPDINTQTFNKQVLLTVLVLLDQTGMELFQWLYQDLTV